MLSAERLREVLHYDPATGVFRWAIWRGPISPGTPAGCFQEDGYLQIKVDGRSYLGQRLAWLYVAGEWPKEFIDHKDGVRSNNRFENLRDVPSKGNAQNRTATSRALSGLVGAAWHQRTKKWRSQIRALGVTTHLGYFPTKEAAHAAYLAAKAKHHTHQPVPRDLLEVRA